VRVPPGQPKAIVHFLGGAFVGAAPQLTYRQLLEQLVEAGFVVVATPYQLRFDYLEVCDDVLDSLEPILAELQQQYGRLPLYGVGHSCGALLHVLLSSLFTSMPREANVLISFNNKQASDAIPFFGELVTPVASSLLQLEREPLFSPALDLITAGRQRLRQLTDEMEAAVAVAQTRPARETDGLNATAWEALLPTVQDIAGLPLQLLPLLDQIAPILREIDGGAVEFEPSPAEMRTAASQLYRTPCTLVLQFDDDSIDESDDLVSVLEGCSGVQLLQLKGTHITPLTPAMLELPASVIPEAPPEFLIGETALREFSDAMEAIVRFLLSRSTRLDPPL